MMRLDIVQPDDWHLHLRDNAMLAAVLPDTLRWAGRAIIMPNLVPPVTTYKDAEAYKARIMGALPEGADFTPLMTLYLTEATDPADLRRAAEAGLISAVKLYPAGATTNSASGVRDIDKVIAVLEAMSEIGLPLLMHGEVVDSSVDIFDREKAFIDRVLEPLRGRLPDLKMVMEHITTADAADYVASQSKNLAATITPHHLVINRNAILAGGIKPHYYCLPVAKRERHRLALLEAALSGDSRYFLGTDSAPHTDANKLMPCGCAGIYNAPNTMEVLAQLFDDAGKLDRLEGFTSLYGPAYYNMAQNQARLVMEKQEKPLQFADHLETEEGPVTVFDPMMDIYWKIIS